MFEGEHKRLKKKKERKTGGVGDDKLLAAKIFSDPSWAA
jgi:hypothetical protein